MDDVSRAMQAAADDDFATAVRAFDRALANRDAAMQTQPALMWYGRSLLAVGRADDAVAHLASAHAVSGDAAVAALLGVALLSSGQAPMAVATLLHALTEPSVAAQIAPYRALLLGISAELAEAAIAERPHQ